MPSNNKKTGWEGMFNVDEVLVQVDVAGSVAGFDVRHRVRRCRFGMGNMGKTQVQFQTAG